MLVPALSWAIGLLFMISIGEGGRWNDIDHYSRVNNYTFRTTFHLRDYGDRTLDHVRFIHVPKTGTTFAATVVHYVCDAMDKVHVDVMVKLNSLVPQPWKLDKTCRKRILVAKSRNGNWWAHIPYREEDKGFAVAIFRRAHSRMVSQLMHMNGLMGQMIAFIGIDDPDVPAIHMCMRNPTKAFNPKSQPFPPDYISAPKPMLPTTCSSAARDEYVAARFTQVKEVMERCMSDNEVHTEQKRRNLCKWAALAHWPGLEGCMTKMVLGRNCCEKCPITQADVEAAKERLSKDFAFVGIQEQWTLSVQAFHASFGGRLYREELMSNRNGRTDGLKKQASASLSKYFNDSVDTELYAHARNLFVDRTEKLTRVNPGWTSLPTLPA